MKRQVWGHRGCRGTGNPPENSLSAFQLAMGCGVSGIEMDVHLSQDGTLVVFHDTTLKRMTGAAGELSAFPLEKLKSLRLHNTEGKSSKEAIPTLDQVLDLVDRQRSDSPFVVNIEIKDPRAAIAVAAMVSQRLAAGWRLEHFLVSSFDMNCLRELKALLPALPLGTLFECESDELAKRMEETRDLQPATVNIPFASLNAAASGLIEKAGAAAVVWTPNETNPSRLSQAEREQLLKRLEEREFVMITDYPKEILQLLLESTRKTSKAASTPPEPLKSSFRAWRHRPEPLALKPSKTRATVTGVLAACLAYNEREILFRPSESGLEHLKSPSEYAELKRFGFSELQLTAGDGVDFAVWERRGALDRPHFLLFHGNRAHWGDTGPGDPQRDRHARLKFIEELASSGAGVTAVTLRGFGKSTAVPSELGFLLDLQRVCGHLAALGLDHRRVVVAGESLGTWAATQAAVYMTAQNRPPALLSLQNPFTCMAEVGEQVVSHYPIVRSLSIHLSAGALDRHVLKNHFYTASLLEALSANTMIHIATSGKDDLVHPSHSDKLAEVSAKHGLKVIRDLYPDALHHNIPPIDFARRVVCLGVQHCEGTSESGPLWGGSFVTAIPIDHLPCL